MKVAGLGLSLPSRLVTNEDIIEMIRSSGHGLSREDEALYLDRVRKVFAHSGAKTRRWLDGIHEKPHTLIRESVMKALREADLPPTAVDYYIYASVSRGFLEPSEAFVVAQGAGMRPKNCFDVIEACNSFSRSAELAQLLLSTGKAKNVVITVAEFCVNGSDYVLQNFKPTMVDELSWRFPSYTLGECAVSAVLTAEGGAWNFRTRTDVSLASACVVGLPHAADYAPQVLQGREQTEVFRSFGQPMHAAAVAASRDLWNELKNDSPAEVWNAPILFPHAPSYKLCEDFSANTGYPLENIYQLFTRFGNVGSASVPMGLALAREEGKLKRGDKVLCMVGAAGMSFMLYDFEF